MKNSPYVSIIVPAHNEEIQIEACVKSIINQKTNIQYEIIVVDNNSTDRTLYILKKLPVRVVNEKILGGSSARNAGANAAKGELLLFLDADTRSPQNHIEKVLKKFRSDVQLDVLAGTMVIFDRGQLVKWFTDVGNYFWW